MARRESMEAMMGGPKRTEERRRAKRFWAARGALMLLFSLGGITMAMASEGCATAKAQSREAREARAEQSAAWDGKQFAPRLILPLRVGRTVLPEKQVANILGFVVLFALLFAVITGLMACVVPDLTTAVTAVAATMCNIGPGLSGVGAVENYAWVPVTGKWILILSMLLGRLEIYTVLIVLAPVSWRR